jgi:3'-5' exoribonuclease
VSPSARSAFSPREWVRDAPFPWPSVLDATDGDAVIACFAVHSVNVGTTRSNAPFLRLQLVDAHGSVEARMWEDVEAVAGHIRPGSYVGVRGCIETYQGQRQLRIDELGLLSIELDDLVLFLPRSARPAQRMEAELTALMDSVSDEGLRTLLQLLLAPRGEVGRAFRLAPAAKQNHHAYLGGLIEHTISVATICDSLAAHYGSAIDRDLLVTGALLHDIGKIREIGARGGFPYTDEGKLLGHILLGLQMVAAAAAAVPTLQPDRLLLLQHLIASHQGRHEWQSPREPRILEGLLLHYADDLDAKINQAGTLVAGIPHGWTAYDRNFGREFLRHRVEAPGTAETHLATAAVGADPEPSRAAETGRNPADPAGSAADAAEGDLEDTLGDAAAATISEGAGATGTAAAAATGPDREGSAATAAAEAGSTGGEDPADAAVQRQRASDVESLDLFES